MRRGSRGDKGTYHLISYTGRGALHLDWRSQTATAADSKLLA